MSHCFKGSQWRVGERSCTSATNSARAGSGSCHSTCSSVCDANVSQKTIRTIRSVDGTFCVPTACNITCSYRGTKKYGTNLCRPNPLIDKKESSRRSARLFCGSFILQRFFPQMLYFTHEVCLRRTRAVPHF